MIARILHLARIAAFQPKATRLFTSLFSSLSLGRLAFWLSLASKRMSLLWGSPSQRAVEYTWVLRQLNRIPQGALILDIGCAESVFSHELAARGFQVIGIDIRNYPLRSARTQFAKGNVLRLPFKSATFDAAFLISTVEHIGLNAYGQRVASEDGDMAAVWEVFRVLKPRSVLILTTPYIGAGQLRVSSSERNYNRKRLEELTSDYLCVKANYFYPQYGTPLGRLNWVQLKAEQIDPLPFMDGAGLACLVLEKPSADVTTTVG